MWPFLWLTRVGRESDCRLIEGYLLGTVAEAAVPYSVLRLVYDWSALLNWPRRLMISGVRMS